MQQVQDIAKSREQLKNLIYERAYKKHSKFKTPTKIVRTYFDFLEISLKHKGVQLTGDIIYDEIKDLEIQAIGGPNHGIASILCRSAFMKEIGVFFVRDSVKQEGDLLSPKWIESRIKAGDRVALVADVVSSGSQLLRSIEEVMQLGGEIAKIIVLIDSQDGGGISRIKRFLQTNMLEVPISVIFHRDEIVNIPRFSLQQMASSAIVY